MKTSIWMVLMCISMAAAAQLPTDALAHYTMDGHAGDGSSNLNNGTITGAVTPTTDRFGNPCGALKFDGTSGYIRVESSHSLKRPGRAFSVAVWVKMEVNPSSPTRKWLTVCCKSDISDETFNSPQFRVQSMQDDLKGYNTVSINTDFTEPAQENLLLSQWFFYVLRYDGSTVTAYIDGKSAFTFPYSKQLNANDMPLEIGRDVPGGMEFFCGSMDDLRIFDRALTVNEISALYNDVSGKAKSQPVAIQCPADCQKTAPAGKCGIPVNYSQPDATVDCGVANVKLIAGPASESFFPIGETTVTYQATSSQGNTATCSFVVRVQDSNLPTIACPKSIVVNADPGMCSAVVQYPDATSPTICATPTVQLVQGGASGDAFPIGDSKVIYRATDANARTAECHFTITVKDAEKPVIDCPQDLQVQAPAGATGTPVSFPDPDFSDNCPNPKLSQTKGPASNALFPVGTSTVSYQVKDAAGNTATCSFAVVVEKQSSELGLTCPQDIVLPANPGICEAAVDYPEPTLTGNLPDATVTRTTGLASGDHFAVGSQTITYQATHKTGARANCSFRVTVKDMEKPTIDCPADVKETVEEGATGKAVTFVDPLIADNCPNPVLTQMAGSDLKSGSTFPIGKSTLTYQVKDAAGNTATCSFHVVVDQQASELGLQCPLDIVVNTDEGECAAVVRFRNATLTGNLPDAVVAQSSGERSGSKFHVGTQTVTFSAAHPSGKQAQCAFRITVKDNENPIVKCPNDVHLHAQYGSNGTNFTFEEPSYADNCPRVKLTQTAGLASNAVFPIGSTTMAFLAKDAAGNTASCQFNVQVSEAEPELPAKIDGDTVVYNKDIVTVGAREVRVYYYDNHDQDGDTISLNFDGKWVVDHQKIMGKKKNLENNRYIDLVLTPGKVHYLVSKAWNEGKKPTNTLTVEIHDGVSLPRVLNLTSNVGKSSAIKLYYKK